MEPLDLQNLVFTEDSHLPIIKEYAKRIGLGHTIDRIVDSQMELKPGLAVLGMVIDTLSGEAHCTGWSTSMKTRIQRFCSE
jgi:hypothetical protein